MDTQQISLFRAQRSLVALHKFVLGLIEDLRAEHDENINKVGTSLVEFEETIERKYGVELDLAHLTKHFSFFDEEKYIRYRKKILDFSNQIQRELQS